MLPPLDRDDVRLMRAAAPRFGEAECARKSVLLAQAGARDIVAADVLVEWHDCLLFLLAYPESAALHRAARAELRRVAAIARRMTEIGPARARRSLEGSGLAGTFAGTGAGEPSGSSKDSQPFDDSHRLV